MDEFLRDNSNSDFGNLTKTHSNPNNQQQYNTSTTTPGTISSDTSNNYVGDLDPFQFAMTDASVGGAPGSGLAATGYSQNSNNNYNNNNNNNQNNLNANTLNFTGDDLLSPSTSYSNDNNFGIFGGGGNGGGGGAYDPLMEELTYSLSNPQQASQNSFLPNQGAGAGNFGSPLGSPQSGSRLQQSSFINPSTTTNLDELISPSNTIDGRNSNTNSLLNPQYFSPPTTRGSNFNSLNPIAEDNHYSPATSRHGSISIPYNNSNNPNNSNLGASAASTLGGYLSPSNYMSPLTNVNSLDLLRSPSYGNQNLGGGTGSYLNSPPEFQITNAPTNTNLNASISNNSSNNNNNHSNNNNNGAGGGASGPQTIPGAGAGGANPLVGVTKQLGTSPNTSGSKQLTKEEKMKRRREFHNAVERRRRDLIKERIKDLGILVPPSLLNPQLCAVQALQRNAQYNSREINDLISNVKAKETKPNKSTILNKSVDYVEHLEYVLKRQKQAREELERKIADIESEVNAGIVGLNTSHAPAGGNAQYIKAETSADYGIPTAGGIEGTNLKFDDPNNSSSVFNPDDFWSDVVTGGGSQTANSNELFDI